MIAKTHQIVYLKMTKMIGFTLFFAFFFCLFVFLKSGSRCDPVGPQNCSVTEDDLKLLTLCLLPLKGLQTGVTMSSLRF